MTVRNLRYVDTENAIIIIYWSKFWIYSLGAYIYLSFPAMFLILFWWPFLSFVCEQGCHPVCIRPHLPHPGKVPGCWSLWLGGDGPNFLIWVVLNNEASLIFNPIFQRGWWTMSSIHRHRMFLAILFIMRFCISWSEPDDGRWSSIHWRETDLAILCIIMIIFVLNECFYIVCPFKVWMCLNGKSCMNGF